MRSTLFFYSRTPITQRKCNLLYLFQSVELLKSINHSPKKTHQSPQKATQSPKPKKRPSNEGLDSEERKKTKFTPSTKAEDGDTSRIFSKRCVTNKEHVVPSTAGRTPKNVRGGTSLKVRD